MLNLPAAEEAVASTAHATAAFAMMAAPCPLGPHLEPFFEPRPMASPVDSTIGSLASVASRTSCNSENSDRFSGTHGLDHGYGTCPGEPQIMQRELQPQVKHPPQQPHHQQQHRQQQHMHDIYKPKFSDPCKVREGGCGTHLVSTIANTVTAVLRQFIKMFTWFGLPQWLMLGTLTIFIYAVHCFFEWLARVAQELVSGTAEASALYGTAALAKHFGPQATAAAGSWLKHSATLYLTGRKEPEVISLMDMPFNWWQDPYMVSMAVLSSVLASVSSCLAGSNS